MASGPITSWQINEETVKTAADFIFLAPKSLQMETAAMKLKDTCIPLFIAALFTIARTWKQPGCPSTNDWLKKLWYIYSMKYYSAIKRNGFESVLMRWMNLEPIIQSEVKSERER